MGERFRRASPVAMVAAIALLAGCAASSTGTASTTPVASSSSVPSQSAAAGTRVLPIGAGVFLNAGSYSLSSFPVGITFEIPALEAPAEWFACSPAPVEQAVCFETAPDTGVAVTFQIVENVVADPCDSQEAAELLDPPVGPSVDDLVMAISSLEGFKASDPKDITVDGFHGKEFTLAAPDTHCGATWATADRTTGVGSGETNLLRILDVGGTRAVIVAAYGPDSSEADVATLQEVMDSVHIEA